MTTSLFRYQGVFSDLITERVTALLDAALIQQHVDLTTRRRLKALLVEQVQNIQRYSRDPQKGVVEVGQDGPHLYVETVNAVAPDARASLGARLDEVSSQDAETLRRRYREVLHGAPSPDARGAGLGFLFLAQKSCPTIEYGFVEEPDHQYSFRLRSYIGGETRDA